MFYRDDDGSVPVLRWLDSLELRVLIKCRARLTLLQELGHQMRRPESDYLGEGIYELRIMRAGRRYRILYSFHGRDMVLLLSGFAKSEPRVPASEIRLAVARSMKFARAPMRHSHRVEIS